MKKNDALEETRANLAEEKCALREQFRVNPEKVRAFYDSLKSLGIESLKKIFPAPRAVVEQNNFDATNNIIGADTDEEIAFASMALFRRKNIEKESPENFQKDRELLQAIFFFFCRELCEQFDSDFSAEQKENLENLFDSALKNGSWFTAQKQAELLNALSANLPFLKENPFSDFDFTKFEGNRFEANESILRILANLSCSDGKTLSKEKIISEMNFIREQQKSILPIYPNTRKTDFSEHDADEEIKKAQANLKKLKELDFGFADSQFTQFFFVNDEKLKAQNQFTRNITCKFFQESEMAWKDGDPRWRNSGKISKILARKDDRTTNKSALNHKFLYPERNMVTHISENFAVYNLFGKEHKESQIHYWERLILHSIFDARAYLLGLQKDERYGEVAEKLLLILNHYFKKIVSRLEIEAETDEELWEGVFAEDGKLKIREYEKTNLYNEKILSEDEIRHFRKFMSFLYCTGNEAEDFIEKHSSTIQIYLLYLTFEFAKMDKIEKSEENGLSSITRIK